MTPGTRYERGGGGKGGMGVTIIAIVAVNSMHMFLLLYTNYLPLNTLAPVTIKRYIIRKAWGVPMLLSCPQFPPFVHGRSLVVQLGGGGGGGGVWDIRRVITYATCRRFV